MHSGIALLPSLTPIAPICRSPPPPPPPPVWNRQKEYARTRTLFLFAFSQDALLLTLVRASVSWHFPSSFYLYCQILQLSLNHPTVIYKQTW